MNYRSTLTDMIIFNNQNSIPSPFAGQMVPSLTATSIQWYIKTVAALVGDSAYGIMSRYALHGDIFVRIPTKGSGILRHAIDDVFVMICQQESALLFRLFRSLFNVLQLGLIVL